MIFLSLFIAFIYYIMTVFSNVNNYIILFIINWEVQSSVIIFFFPYAVMLVSTLHVHVSRFFFVFFFRLLALFYGLVSRLSNFDRCFFVSSSNN